MKKWISLLLAAAMALSLAIPALAATPSFSDISDPELREEVDILRMLGLVGGDGSGNFNPSGTLTRAEFCKMAIVAMGKGDLEPLYRNRTLFPDVRSSHWARGYINLAANINTDGSIDSGSSGGSSGGEGGGTASTATKLVRGTGDGTFQPDRNITFAEAVTTLMRILGYNDSDAGMLWPQGYLNLAAQTGLSEGISASANDPITRAQAAHLFCNLLGSDLKDGGSYLSKLGNGTPVEDVIILAVDVTVNGKEGVIRTTEGDYTSASGVVPASIQGRRGTVVANSKGEMVTFLPDDTRQLDITVSNCNANWVEDSSGARYTIDPDTKAYRTSDTESTTFSALWTELMPGAQLTLFYNEQNKIDAVYYSDGQADSDNVMVAWNKPSGNPFASLVGSASGYTILKNGAPAGTSDLRQYDVATYDAGTNTLRVTDLKLTGLYENVWPNTDVPSTIMVLGHEFNVLPSALSSLSEFDIGDSITLLLTGDANPAVAGVVSSSSARTNAVGVAQCSGSSATVELLGSNLVLEGKINQDRAEELDGQLVTVSSARVGDITLSRLTGSGATSNLNVAERKLGNVALNPNVILYERVGTSTPVRLKSINDLTQDMIPASDIVYVHTDYAGRADIIVFDDVTGDRYEYGFFVEDKETFESFEPGGTSYYNRLVSVRNRSNPSGDQDAKLVTGTPFTAGAAGGYVKAFDKSTNKDKAIAVVTLIEVKNVSRTAFHGNDYVLVNGIQIPISDQVQCYNAVTKTWFGEDRADSEYDNGGDGAFQDLADARAFSDNLTIYYDRAPEDGGKVRLVVAR